MNDIEHKIKQQMQSRRRKVGPIKLTVSCQACGKKHNASATDVTTVAGQKYCLSCAPPSIMYSETPVPWRFAGGGSFVCRWTSDRPEDKTRTYLPGPNEIVPKSQP